MADNPRIPPTRQFAAMVAQKVDRVDTQTSLTIVDQLSHSLAGIAAALPLEAISNIPGGSSLAIEGLTSLVVKTLHPTDQSNTMLPRERAIARIIVSVGALMTYYEGLQPQKENEQVDQPTQDFVEAVRQARTVAELDLPKVLPQPHPTRRGQINFSVRAGTQVLLTALIPDEMTTRGDHILESIDIVNNALSPQQPQSEPQPISTTTEATTIPRGIIAIISEQLKSQKDSELINQARRILSIDDPEYTNRSDQVGFFIEAMHSVIDASIRNQTKPTSPNIYRDAFVNAFNDYDPSHDIFINIPDSRLLMNLADQTMAATIMLVQARRQPITEARSFEEINPIGPIAPSITPVDILTLDSPIITTINQSMQERIKQYQNLPPGQLERFVSIIAQRTLLLLSELSSKDGEGGIVHRT